MYFPVEGPVEILGGVKNFGNPAKSSFGIVTVLIRGTTSSGKIMVRAFVKGLESMKLLFESKPAKLKMLYDEEYIIQSKKENKDIMVI